MADASDPLGPEALTLEIPAPGLQVWQPRRGYRYGVEVYALADFALRGGVTVTAVDLGSGSGVIALLLAAAGARVTSVERDPRWLTLLRRNVIASGVDVEIVAADVRAWTGGPYDVAVANPPWFDPARGPISPDPWRAASRTAIHGAPEDFLDAGLRAAPRVCMVGPRLPRLPEGVQVRRAAALGRLHLYELARADVPGTPIEVPGPPWDLPAAYARWR